MSRKTRRHFTDDFKQPIVDLHNTGRKRSELIALRKRQCLWHKKENNHCEQG